MLFNTYIIFRFLKRRYNCIFAIFVYISYRCFINPKVRSRREPLVYHYAIYSHPERIHTCMKHKHERENKEVRKRQTILVASFFGEKNKFNKAKKRKTKTYFNIFFEHRLHNWYNLYTVIIL